MTTTKKKKNVTIVDTCVLSHKPIKQYHIDNKKVINWGKGRAFISAIKKSVPSPTQNPIVISGSDLEEVTLRFEAWHFPWRIKILGKNYVSFPKRIYLHNAEFVLDRDIGFDWFYRGPNGETENDLPETEDQIVRTGTVTYLKKLPPPIDNTSK